jgi:hypothetical protein
VVAAYFPVSLLHLGTASSRWWVVKHGHAPAALCDKCDIARWGGWFPTAVPPSHGGTIVVACVARAFSIHGVVVAGVSEAPVSRLLGEKRSKLPSHLMP